LTVIDCIAAHKVLSIGIVDGRNIWRTDLQQSLSILQDAQIRLGARLWVAPSCALLDSPVDLQREEKLRPELKSGLAVATQKTEEVVTLKTLLSQPENQNAQQALANSNAAVETRRNSPLIHNPSVQARLQGVKPQDSER